MIVHGPRAVATISAALEAGVDRLPLLVRHGARDTHYQAVSPRGCYVLLRGRGLIEVDALVRPIPPQVLPV